MDNERIIYLQYHKVINQIFILGIGVLEIAI